MAEPERTPPKRKPQRFKDPEKRKQEVAAAERARHRAFMRLKEDHPTMWLHYLNLARVEEGLNVQSGRAWTWRNR